jgi:hypothetical protein
VSSRQVVCAVSDRDRDGVPGVVKLGLGVGVGLAIYMLFGGSGGFGLGRGGGFGRGEAAPAGPPQAPTAPPRPPDAIPIEVRVKPSPTDPKQGVIELEGKIVTVDDLVARIHEGGRRDVVVVVRGDTIQGAWDKIHDAIVAAGIEIVRRTPPSSAPAPKR